MDLKTSIKAQGSNKPSSGEEARGHWQIALKDSDGMQKNSENW